MVLGIGRKVDVTTTAGERVRGKIQTIRDDGLVLTRREQAPTQIAYNVIRQLEPQSMSTAAKIGIAAAVAAGIFLLLYVRSVYTS